MQMVPVNNDNLQGEDKGRQEGIRSGAYSNQGVPTNRVGIIKSSQALALSCTQLEDPHQAKACQRGILTTDIEKIASASALDICSNQRLCGNSRANLEVPGHRKHAENSTSDASDMVAFETKEEKVRNSNTTTNATDSTPN